MSADTLAALIRRLEATLPPGSVLTEPQARVAYAADGMTHLEVVPPAVVLPRTTAEVTAAVGLCAESGVPFVARGAGTGLSGGALPVAHGVVIATARMNRILEVDLRSRRVTVQPGVINTAVSAAVAAAGLYYAPDPSSQVACTIGGNVGENAGGAHCLKYGVTANHVLGLTVVLPDGQVVRLGGKAEEYPGPDLVALMVGSEGLLGIVTEVVLRVLVRPEAAALQLAAFDSVAAAGAAVAAVIGAGIVPGAMEIMDRLAIQATEIYAGAGYPTDAGAILLVEVDGPAADVGGQAERVRALLAAHGARRVRVARSEDERARMWKGRKGAFAAMGRISPDYYVLDGVLPRGRLARALERIADLSARHGLRVANVFHAGDGNLHPLILYDGSQPGQAERAEAMGQEILRLCVEAGGSITGEHGVGVEKRDFMGLMFSPDDLDTMRAIKDALDPAGLANPGKMLPAPEGDHRGGKSHATLRA